MMDFIVNAGGTTRNYDTNLYRDVQPKPRANKRDIERHACRSGAGHWRVTLPQSLCQTNPNQPQSLYQPSAETLADLWQVTGEHQRAGWLVITGVGER